jgi:hypothetical protein
MADDTETDTRVDRQATRTPSDRWWRAADVRAGPLGVLNVSRAGRGRTREVMLLAGPLSS